MDEGTLISIPYYEKIWQTIGEIVELQKESKEFLKRYSLDTDKKIEEKRTKSQRKRTKSSGK